MFSSINCADELEKNFTDFQKKLKGSLTTLILIFALPELLPYIIAILERKNLSYVKPASLGITIFCFIMMITCVCIYGVLISKVHNAYTLYRNACSAETLIIDNEKVYGSTINEDLRLYFSQIQRVTHYQNTQNTGKNLSKYGTVLTKNDILEIQDTAGNTFIFHTFKNTPILKAAIDQKRFG